MYDSVNPSVRPPQALQFNALATAEMSRVSQPYLNIGATQADPQPAKPEPVAAEAPRVSPVELSRVLLNAESMIASVMGLKTYEVSVIVNAGRYQY